MKQDFGGFTCGSPRPTLRYTIGYELTARVERLLCGPGSVQAGAVDPESAQRFMSSPDSRVREPLCASSRSYRPFDLEWYCRWMQRAVAI